MCGSILIGAIAAIALIKVAKCAFRWRYGCHGGYRSCAYRGGGDYDGGYGGGYDDCGGGHYSGYGRRGRFGRGFGESERGRESEGRGGPGKRWVLRWVFERLDTSPGQEKVILEAFDEIKDAMKKAKGEWGSSFGDFAKAMRGIEFDHTAVSDAFVRHDGLFEEARTALTTALQKVHEALDEKQRAILADLIESGPGRFKGRFGGRRPEWV